MRPVNLIPPEDRRGESAPLRTGPAAYVLLGVLGLALLTITMLVMTGNSVKDREAELASLDAREQAATAAAASLTPYTQFASLAAARDATVTSLAQSRFDWERVLRELSLIIPADVTLSTTTASTAPGGGGAEGASPLAETATGPSLSIQGCASSQRGVAAFAAALHDIDGVTRVGVSSSHTADAGTASSGGNDTPSACQAGPSTSDFDVVVVFDGVAPPADGTAPPADGTAPPADGTTADTPATDPATADAVAEEQQSRDDATAQTDKARKAANLAPGVSQ